MLCVAQATKPRGEDLGQGAELIVYSFGILGGGQQHSARSSLLIVGKSNKIAYLDGEIYPKIPGRESNRREKACRPLTPIT
jgi:hypothetical protein